MITLEGLRFGYGDGEFTLKLDDLRIAQGERVACIGPSGVGKTTLVNLIAGITPPSSGRITVGQTLVTGLSEAQRRAHRIRNIGMVFQEFELLDYMSALENILLPYYLSSHLRLSREIKDRAGLLAKTMGIEPLLERRPHHLSQGERQRVAICRALITSPSLVLADEPTGNLDPKTATTTLDLLFDQSARAGATLFMVTHNHGVLRRFDRVVDLGAIEGAKA